METTTLLEHFDHHMRKSGEWMTIWDDRILEYIYVHGASSPSDIAQNDHVTVSKQYISRRLGELADHHLLNPAGHGVYLLSEEGRYYLAGEYNAEIGEFLEEDLEEYDLVLMGTGIDIKRKIDELGNRVEDYFIDEY